MEKDLIYAAIKNRKITIFVVILATIFGSYNYYLLPKKETPEIKAPIAIITAQYPGASPEEVEQSVTRKIEDKVVEVPGYQISKSISQHSASIVILELDKDTDLDKSWSDLRQKMDELSKELSGAVGVIEVTSDVTETAGIIISMSGEGYSYQDLAFYAEMFKKELSRISGIARFEIDGTQDKQINININSSLFNQLDLSMEDITNIIASQNIDIPLGKLKNQGSSMNVSATGSFSTLEAIENTIIMAVDGSIVRLKDIASISMELDDSQSIVKQNGKNTVLLTGYFKDNKNIVLIGEEVERKIDDLKENLPKDIIFEQVLFQPKDVSASVNNFIINLVQGIFFVIIVVFIGMGIRNAIIVSMAIPLSILITFSVMALWNIQIHQISIAALIIALGMLVDNAIVVSDSIQVRIDGGQERIHACVDGVKEVAIPIFTSTLTTVGAFLPLMLLTGMAGEYIKSVPQIVMISLLSSYGVALMVTPMMAFILFKKREVQVKEVKIRIFFQSILKKSMKRKKKTIAMAVLALAAALILASTLGLQFFPKADTDMIYIDVSTEKDGNLSKTEAVVEQIEEVLVKNKEVVSYTTAIGEGLPKFYNTLPIYTKSQDFAQIMLILDLKLGNRFKTNTDFVNAIQKELDLHVVGAVVTVKELEQADPTGAPIYMRVTGDDLERLEEVASQLKEKLKSMKGTVNVDDDLSDKSYEFNIVIDEVKSSLYGISKYDIQNEISIALRGKKASVLKQGGNEVEIIVNSDIHTKGELENLAIKSPITGKKVVLKEMTEIGLITRIPNIKKYDREMTVSIFSDVESGYSAVKIQNLFIDELQKMNITDVNIHFDGEKEKIVEYFGDMGILSVFAILIIYGILLLQFNSFIQPFIILVTIPLSVIGSILGLFIFRQHLSFTGLMGIVSLLGIVVNNAIVLIDFINYERKIGKDIDTACREAVEKRFRPIILTTATTVMGLIPLIFSGSELFRPMAISLMFGLMVSTLLTLVIIPVVYSYVESKFDSLKNK